MKGSTFLAVAALGIAGLAAGGGCTTLSPQPTTYFDQTIDPILQSSCVRTNTGVGCHVADAKGNAFGNLDLSTFDGVNRRRDLLLDYGPYLQPSLLVKNVPPYAVEVQLWDGTKVNVTTDIKHTGGPILDPTASAYQILRRWIENGATVDNTGVAPTNLPRQPCNEAIPTANVYPAATGFNGSADPTTKDWAVFQQKAEPVLGPLCAAGNCHGTLVNALYLTCGRTPAELRWNYFAASSYLAPTAEQSELLRRPLATSQGGSYHEGGAIYASVNDANYGAIKAWETAHGPPAAQTLDPAFTFFAQMVQPVLVKKGCMMAQCHSAAMFHDYRLRGGSAASFSYSTTRKNYDLSVAQMSFESDDVAASRLVRKNLYRPEVFTGSNGLAHRGGPLFEDFGTQLPSGAVCDMASYSYDPAHVDQIPAFCVIYEWHKRERTERKLAAPSAVVYVSRAVPSGSDRPQDFDVFAGGASLHIAQVTAQPGGALTLGTDAVVNLSTCQLGAGPDIRRPAVSWGAKTIAFAARASATDPLAIYTVDATGAGCTKQGDIGNHGPTAGGLLVHDFDPAFSPPDASGNEKLVFASTRGNLDATGFDYTGPSRTPDDPSKPNANLYVWDPESGNPDHVRQLTWQLNVERLPSFMQDGRLVFTAEKREPNFYELALRRQNLDGTDYHPLYAQRGSIGYPQATYVTELSHKDFAAIFSDTNAVHGAGALVVFNRSIGVDFTSTSKSDYLVDPTVLQPGSPSAIESDFFLHSLSIVASDGSYTSPSALPDGQVLVSFGTGAPASFGGDYDVYVLDPATGNKTKLVGAAGTAETDAVAVFPRVAKGIFTATGDEPNGNTTLAPGGKIADVQVLDMTTLASLLFQNTPTGRVVEPDLPNFEVWEELPPDVSSMPSSCSGNTACDSLGPLGKVYTRRRLIGTVPLLADGSAHFKIPGGMPILLHLADDSESKAKKLPRWQRETMTFIPGEAAHQSFRGVFFNNLCGGCHGAISGKPFDVALSPDFLTQASLVDAKTAPAIDMTEAPNKRGSIKGPPFSP